MSNRHLKLAVLMALLPVWWTGKSAEAGADPGPAATTVAGAPAAGAATPAATEPMLSVGVAGVPTAKPSADSVKACLGEGQQCNPLNDLCCAGYYCTGGLLTRCARKL